MALVDSPPPQSHNSLAALVRDVMAQRSISAPFPPGEHRTSLARNKRYFNDPLSLLLESYERFGPIFTLKLFQVNFVYMLGPAANHYITVSHASNFTWRNSHLRDLMALTGDGLFTTDGDFHRRSRQTMLPAFHRDRIAASIDVMIEETDHALGQFTPDSQIDVYAWARRLILRILTRALLGLDPDGDYARSVDVASLFERALSFYSTTYYLRPLRGPFTPWARFQRAVRKLDSVIYAEIARRRTTGERGTDILSLLLEAQDEDGVTMSDLQIRDQMMTLMFAGHDSTTSTIAFLFYELARNPIIAANLRAEQDAQLRDGIPTAAQMASGELVALEMVIDETLRKYPPPSIGPRRSVEQFEFEGHVVPAGAFVTYSLWASHHLPDVFPQPSEFRPERFTPEARSALPKGAYVPFGGGSRTCIGMRFAQAQIRTIATLILSRFDLALPDDFHLELHHAPTISPKGGLPVIVHPRPSARPVQAAASGL
jgi:cytochrome P450